MARRDARCIGFALAAVLGTCSVAAAAQPGGKAARGSAGACWQLLPVNRVRVVPRSGEAAAMIGGTIQGSNDSPTQGFTVLATLAAAPADNPTYTEVAFENATPYRFIKYYAPGGNPGQIAEIEFYSGTNRLAGTGFGTAGSRSGNPWPLALDGDPATFFDGPTGTDTYVGIDAASENLTGAPVFSPAEGTYSGPLSVRIGSSTRGATIRYTTDGTDPAIHGIPYTGPILVRSGSTVLRAIAGSRCFHPNAASAVYTVGESIPSTQASLHLGNSITDALDNWLQPVATSGGVTLDFQRYTIPGAGTWLYEDNPTGGCCVKSGNVQNEVRTRRLDHISFQPFSNMPCAVNGYANEPNPQSRSDAVLIAKAWDDAVPKNPNVQMWVVDQWVPTKRAIWSNCINGGAWIRDPAPGQPAWKPPDPVTWEIAQRNEQTYVERVRAALAALRPTRPPPYIIPAGRAFAALKAEIEAGGVPGWATTSFFQHMYADETHASTDGRYFVSLVFCASMFKRSPVGLPHDGTTLTSEQAARLQQIAWDTVKQYPPSGIERR